MMTAEANHIERYRAIREKMNALQQDLLKSYLAKDAMAKSAKKLGIPMKGKTFLFGSPEEMSILFDYSLYDYREIPFSGKPKNAIEKRLDRDPPAAGTDELELLRAGAAARYALLIVEAVEQNMGVQVHDLLTQQHFLLTDIHLGKSAVPGLGLATRIISAFGITMTTGTGLPMDRSTAENVFAELASVLDGRAVKDFATMAPGEKSRVSAAIIRTCLQSGASERVRSEWVREDP